MIESFFNVRIKIGHSEAVLHSHSDKLNHKAAHVITHLHQLTNHPIHAELVNSLLNDRDQGSKLHMTDPIRLSRKAINPRNNPQAEYLKSIDKQDIIFAVGPAGTGKTYLAVAKAIESFEKGEVQRLVFVRPAVEAGEKLGFLPGDLVEKVLPYLRPIYDALYDDRFQRNPKINKI